MRILFVTPQPPHPSQGGAAIRNWHLMDAALKAGHRTDLLTFGLFRSHDGESDVLPMRPRGTRNATDRLWDLVTQRRPDLISRLGAETLRPCVARLVNEHHYDAVQIEGLEMWPALPAMNIPAIYDAHNAEATLQRRIARQAARDRHFARAAYSITQVCLLQMYERSVIERAAATIAVSASDAAALRGLAPRSPVDVVPIGVDTAYFAPDAVAPTPDTTFDVLFTGTMGYHANLDAALWFARIVWPRIRAMKPDARFGVVGHGPTAAIQELHGRDGITVTGAVRDDRPYMAGAGIYVLPIRVGAGMRVKLLNAMSMGCAVVATPAACEGIAAIDDEHLVIAEPDSARFATAVLAQLDNGTRRKQLGKAARTHMQASYEWSLCTPKLLEVYARLERDYA